MTIITTTTLSIILLLAITTRPHSVISVGQGKLCGGSYVGAFACDPLLDCRYPRADAVDTQAKSWWGICTLKSVPQRTISEVVGEACGRGNQQPMCGTGLRCAYVVSGASGTCRADYLELGAICKGDGDTECRPPQVCRAEQRGGSVAHCVILKTHGHQDAVIEPPVEDEEHD